MKISALSNERCFLIACLILLTSCALAVPRDSIDVVSLVSDYLKYDRSAVEVSGCLRRVGSSVRLADCKNPTDKFYIDVVGSVEGSIGEDFSGSACLSGYFRAYSDDFVGMGYLNSDFGVVEVEGGGFMLGECRKKGGVFDQKKGPR